MVPPNCSISCPGLQPRLKSLWGWQVTWDAKAPSKKSIHVNILHPAVSPQRMSCKGPLSRLSGHQVLQPSLVQPFDGHRDCWQSLSASQILLGPCFCCP